MGLPVFAAPCTWYGSRYSRYIEGVHHTDKLVLSSMTERTTEVTNGISIVDQVNNSAAMSPPSKSLRLYPWRDGMDYCLQLLEPGPPPVPLPTSSKRRRPRVVSSIRNGCYTYDHDHISALTSSPTSSVESTITVSPIESVDVCLDEADRSRAGQHSNQRHPVDLTKLFEAIARLPRLLSLLVRASVSGLSKHNNSLASVPLPALTNLLSDRPCLQYLTLIGVPVGHHDVDSQNDVDLDWAMNGFLEALRIHPGLQSVALKDCSFAKYKHWKRCHGVLHERMWPSATTFVQHNNTVVNQQQTRLSPQAQHQSNDCGLHSWWVRWCLCGV